MSTPAASRSAVRLLSNLPKPSTRYTTSVPFFYPSSTSFRSLPFFYPSRQSVSPLRSQNSYFTASTPSPTFTSLRTAFHTSSRPSPLSKPSIASIQRSFSTSTVSRGIRPYYGRGGSGGGGRGQGGWKDKINSVDQKWILGGLLGESEPSLVIKIDLLTELPTLSDKCCGIRGLGLRSRTRNEVQRC